MSTSSSPPQPRLAVLVVYCVVAPVEELQPSIHLTRLFRRLVKLPLHEDKRDVDSVEECRGGGWVEHPHLRALRVSLDDCAVGAQQGKEVVEGDRFN